VISAPFISKALFKRQAGVYFGSWNPVLGLKKTKNKKKKSQKKISSWNNRLLKKI